MAHDVLAGDGMFGSLTRLFKRSAPKHQTAPPPSASPLPPENDAASAESDPLQFDSGPQAVPTEGDAVTLSFSSIIKHVPPDLHGKNGARGGSGARFSISKAQVLKQLPHGSVKVSFGELRQAAPAGIFLNS